MCELPAIAVYYKLITGCYKVIVAYFKCINCVLHMYCCVLHGSHLGSCPVLFPSVQHRFGECVECVGGICSIIELVYCALTSHFPAWLRGQAGRRAARGRPAKRVR